MTAVVGMARPKKNWPPPSLKVPKNALFNDLYWCIDEHGTLVARWIDNNQVLLVSTAHYPTETVQKSRKLPRMTVTNRTHVAKVWGTSPRKVVSIPAIVEDCNANMGEVDLADQRIAS